MTQRATLLLLAGSALIGLAACKGEVVPNGAWGDDHVSLTVSDNGGRVEFDCAHGTIDHPLRLDDLGRFSVPGTYVPEHSGPVQRGEKVESRPARYQGRLDRAEDRVHGDPGRARRRGPVHGDPGQGAEADEVPLSGPLA